MRNFIPWPRSAVLLSAAAALTLLVAGCAVAAEAAGEILLEVAKQVSIQVGANYLTKILSPDDSGGKPTVTVSYTDSTGYAAGTSYAVAGTARVTTSNVTIKNPSGKIDIANDSNGISVTVANGASSIIDIKLGSANGGNAVGAGQVAATINGILGWSGRTRSSLYDALNNLGDCDSPPDAIAELRTVAAGRTQQIGSLHQLDVSALQDGESLRDTLVQALNYSFQADQAFIRWGVSEQSGCWHDSNYDEGMSYSHSATAAKKQFLGSWNALAGNYGLPAYQEPDI